MVAPQTDRLPPATGRQRQHPDCRQHRRINRTDSGHSYMLNLSILPTDKSPITSSPTHQRDISLAGSYLFCETSGEAAIDTRGISSNSQLISAHQPLQAVQPLHLETALNLSVVGTMATATEAPTVALSCMYYLLDFGRNASILIV